MLTKKAEWLSMVINDREATFANIVGLPGSNTMAIGLEHLASYLNIKGDMIEPSVTTEENMGKFPIKMNRMKT